MDLELKDKIWKEFINGKIFTISSTSSGIDKNKIFNKIGQIPYVTRTEQNNGYDSFIGEQNSIYRLDGGNVRPTTHKDFTKKN